MSQVQDENWHFAGLVDDFEDEDIEQIKVGQLAIAVYRAEGNFYATQDLCTHEHAYLSDGVLIDCVVECPFHQGRFDVRTGAALGAPVIVAAQDLSGQARRRKNLRPCGSSRGGGRFCGADRRCRELKPCHFSL